MFLLKLDSKTVHVFYSERGCCESIRHSQVEILGIKFTSTSRAVSLLIGFIGFMLNQVLASLRSCLYPSGFDNVMTKFVVNNRTDAWKLTSILHCQWLTVIKITLPEVTSQCARVLYQNNVRSAQDGGRWGNSSRCFDSICTPKTSSNEIICHLGSRKNIAQLCTAVSKF